MTLIGVGLDDEMPPAVGVAVADKVNGPRRAGFQEQVTVNGATAAVGLLMQPGMRTPLTRKTTFAPTLTVAEI
jgi:hypothetical protein